MQTITLARSVAGSKRMLWLDLAKSYGMVLVFLGHIVESFSIAGLASAFLSYKLIYSFHMALFFLLAGYVSKPATGSLFDVLKLKFLTRIIPFLFFNAIALVGKLGLDVLSGDVVFRDYLQGIYLLIKGLPEFNITTWFLICLLSVELIHFVATKYFHSDRVLTLVAIVLFGLGWVLTLKYRFLAWNYWFMPAASVAYLFYAIGYVLKQRGWLSQEGSCKDVYLFLGCAVATLLTFNLNQTFFALPADIVFMSLSSYGQPVLFLFTGLSGSLAVIYLARSLSSVPWGRSRHSRLGLRFVGLNTLILLGLNGLFFPVNHRLAPAITPYLPDNQLSTLVVCGVLTVLSLLICVPVVIGLKRYVPQWVGFPKADGSILSRLMS